MVKEFEVVEEVDSADSESGANWSSSEVGSAIDSLQRVVHFLLEAQQNPWVWKWVILSMHDAFYGFAVCAVAGGDYSRVTGKKKKEASGLWDDLLAMGLKGADAVIRKVGPSRKKEAAAPEAVRKARLFDFPSILQMCQQKQYMEQNYGSSVLQLSEQDQRLMERLDELRDTFSHFLPADWSVEVGEIVQVCTVCLNNIRFLALDSGNVLPGDARQQRARVEALCASGMSLAETLQKQHVAD